MIYELTPFIPADALVVDRYAVTTTGARAAVKNIKGEPNGQIRHVVLTPRFGIDALEVHGPRDGRPLIIDVVRGFTGLKIMSGHVVIHADSSFGNSIDVADGARVDVVVTRQRKVSSTVHGTGRLDVHVEPDANPHGYLGTQSPDAAITVHGDNHRFTVRTVEGVTRAGVR